MGTQPWPKPHAVAENRFGNVEVTAVGVELDLKLAALLFHLGVTIPDALLTT
jgi:hypothetical protein